ncbi:MAG: hypothetical protein RL609_312 [Bacteroidota bacterium]|jgi:hypothetical protein
MKTFIPKILILISFSFGCSKEKTNDLNKKENLNVKTQSVVYSIQTCDCPDGTCGAKCDIDPLNEDCCLITECKCGSQIEHFSIALTSNYSQSEIEKMRINNTRITDPTLIEALRKDGFCFK